MPKKQVTISGFMILKNGVSLGYPFLEAIMAALPACDEFLISDGYSSDATWEALQALRAKFPERIVLFRDEWKGRTNHGEVLADMTNVLKARCSGEYCLNIQANEVLHEYSAEEIRSLPQLYPGVEIFSLPFYNILGSHLLWTVDFRRRLFKNRKYILSKGDGFDFYYDAMSLFYEHSRQWLDYYVRGVGIKAYYLPEPFYRYRCIFPHNYLQKIKGRFELYRNERYQMEINEEYQAAERTWNEVHSADQNSGLFWKKMRLFFDRNRNPVTVSPFEQLPEFCIKDLSKGPDIMKHLLNKWKYDLNDSVACLELKG